MDLALSKAVDRLEAVLTAETGALASGTPIDLGEIAADSQKIFFKIWSKRRFAKKIQILRFQNSIKNLDRVFP